MLHQKSTRTIVGMGVLSLMLLTPLATSAQEAPPPLCEEENGEDDCMVETFATATTTTKSCPYVSPNQFEFHCISSGNPQVQNVTNLGNGLYFTCDGIQMVGPNEETFEYVTFVFKGFDDTWINFVAYDSSNNVVDETLKLNLSGDDGAEVVHLGTGSEPIKYVEMFHSNDTCEQIDCHEPLISEIRACDRRFP